MSPLLHHLYELAGERAVLLPIPKGKKGPEGAAASDWQNTTFEQTQEPVYQRKLESKCRLGGNIGALLGPASSNLCAIDIDTDAEIEAFLKLNPKLAKSLRSRGANGCQIWVRIIGEYPAIRINSELKIPGIKKKDKSVAEWRGGGGHQSVIYGKHPDGVSYRFMVEAPAIEVAFDNIKWPEHWKMPGLNGNRERGYDDVKGGERTPLEAALEKLSIADVWRLCGVEGEPPGRDKAVRSPFRDDKNPSFSIYDNGKRWKDHGTGEHGDAADFLAKAKNLSKADACRELIRLAGTGPEANKGGGAAHTHEPWPDMLLLEEYLEPVLPMRHDMMPEALGDRVSEIATELHSPLDFAAVAQVVAVGSVIASRVRIRPLHYKRWQVAPNLWGGMIGEPGTKKTPTMAEAFKVLDRLKIEEAQALEKAKETYKRAMAEYAREVKAYRDSIDKLRKKQIMGRADQQDDERLAQLKVELNELLAREPQAPQRRRYRLNDPTIEAVQEILKTDDTCLLIDRDELSGLISQWEMEGHQNDRSFYLESWNGLNPYDGARIGRGDFFIACLCASLFGGIQPGKLVQYLRNSKVCLTTDGALQRFQLLVYPNRPPITRLVDQLDIIDAKTRFFEVAKRLATADFLSYGGQSDQFNSVPWFHFSIEAKEQFVDWHEKNGLFIADTNTSALLRQHFAKFDKVICGLALIFHLIELADERVTNPSKLRSEQYIPTRIFEQALSWVEYLASHARRIYGLSENPSLGSAVLLGAKLKDSEVKNPLEPGFTVYDVERHHWVGLSTQGEINSALARLADVNWVRPLPDKKASYGGRPTVHYDIHPDILKGRKEGQKL